MKLYKKIKQLLTKEQPEDNRVCKEHPEGGCCWNYNY